MRVGSMVGWEHGNGVTERGVCKSNCKSIFFFCFSFSVLYSRWFGSLPVFLSIFCFCPDGLVGWLVGSEKRRSVLAVCCQCQICGSGWHGLVQKACRLRCGCSAWCLGLGWARGGTWRRKEGCRSWTDRWGHEEGECNAFRGGTGQTGQVGPHPTRP